MSNAAARSDRSSQPSTPDRDARLRLAGEYFSDRSIKQAPSKHPYLRTPEPNQLIESPNMPIAAGWSDRARAMALKTVSDWLRLHLQIWVALLATANGQVRERASDERRRKAERGGFGTPHSRGVSETVLGVSGAQFPGTRGLGGSSAR